MDPTPRVKESDLEIMIDAHQPPITVDERSTAGLAADLRDLDVVVDHVIGEAVEASVLFSCFFCRYGIGIARHQPWQLRASACVALRNPMP